MNGPLRPVALFVLLAMATYPLVRAQTEMMLRKIGRFRNNAVI